MIFCFNTVRKKNSDFNLTWFSQVDSPCVIMRTVSVYIDVLVYSSTIRGTMLLNIQVALRNTSVLHVMFIFWWSFLEAWIWDMCLGSSAHCISFFQLFHKHLSCARHCVRFWGNIALKKQTEQLPTETSIIWTTWMVPTWLWNTMHLEVAFFQGTYILMTEAKPGWDGDK